MYENVDGRMTDVRVVGILTAHLGAFGSGELKSLWSKGLIRHVNIFTADTTFVSFGF